MNSDAKKRMCRGCRNDYYNHAGHSTTGECWMFQKSKIVERILVGTWQNPPYRDAPRETLDCHTPESGTTWIKRDDCRVLTETSTMAE
jgi:hypothetical protein